MKVLIADKLSNTAVTSLQAMGLEVVSNPDLSAEELVNHLADVDIVVVRSTKVITKAVEAAPRLSLIVRAGAGVNTIDVKTASARGIYVANCPGQNNDAVAELVIGLLIAADRRIVPATDALRQGQWKKKEFSKARGLKGRTLGILGLGSIGQAVAQRALGLEMNVVAWSRSLIPQRAEELGIGYASSPEELAGQSDALTVHVAYSKTDTHHLVGKKLLDLMKPGTILINTSRGEVVDTTALKQAIRDKQLRVALDVFENEPAPGEAPFEDKELAQMVVAATHHVGASTDQASEAIAAETIRVIKAFLDTGVPLNSVNLRTQGSSSHTLVVRHLNHVGVLAGVLDALRAENVNIEEMSNRIFQDAKAACATLAIDHAPTAKTLQTLKQDNNILEVSLNSNPK